MTEGMDSLLKRLEKIEKISLNQPVGRAISYIQSAAKTNCLTGDGELRESIFTAVEEQDGGIHSICYTNKKHAPYVEFGTGPRGQKNHAGISPNVPVAYSQSPWWIHESQIGRETAEKYHFFHIDTPKGRFYQCTGQAAHPFMYPALRDHEKEVTDIISEEIRRQLT